MAQTDRFLAAHEVSPGVYQATGLPVLGFAEQMLRGEMLAEHLLASGQIGAHRPLLVCGANVIGVTCAMVVSFCDRDLESLFGSSVVYF